MSLSLQQLRYLAAVAEHGSLTRAAASLGVTQPVLSRALAALQQALEVPLLQRSERRLVLTEAGQAALGPARRALAAVDELTRSVARSQRPPMLRLAAAAQTLQLLAPMLRQWQQSRASMQVLTMCADTPERVVELLHTHQVDLAFGPRPPADAGLRWVPWGAAEVVLVSPADLVLPQQPTAQALAEVELLCPPVSNLRQRTFDDWFLHAGVRPRVVMEVEDTTVLLALVQAGLGSFLGWRFFCEGTPGVRLRSLSPAQTVEVGFSHAPRPARQVREVMAAALAWQASMPAGHASGADMSC